MNVGTLQQLIRIVLYSGGAYFLGDAVANGEMYQAVLGASGTLVAFIWWLLWERNRVK